jgi:tetratricopeptide (TPR) repeat protein
MRNMFATMVLFLGIASASLAQAPTVAPPPPALPSLLKSGEAVQGAPQIAMPSMASGTAGRSFISQGQSYLNSGRLGEAKEALRMAIRLEPMNLEAWSLYDYVVETHYLGQSREDKKNPYFEGNFFPSFSIERVESYMEFGTLYLIGEVKNVSTELRRQVELMGILIDENRQEIRRETTLLSLSDRGIFPGETRLFEIRFRSPPPGVKSFRVKVSKFE